MNEQLISEIVSPKANEQVNKLTADLVKTNAEMQDTILAAKLLNDTLSQTRGFAQYNRAANDSAIAQERLAQAQLRTEAAQLRLTQAQERAAATQQRTTQRTNEQARAYAALDAQHKKLLKDAQDIGVVFGTNSQQFKDAAKAANELDKKLKDIDAALGRRQRNVGNYASGWNGLGNSINQITREFPAFTNSVQTGFLAISNNLPIFFDQIANTRREIAAMRAEGQKVPGLFAQLTASIFSWGTALSLGVTLLTMYGKDIVAFVSSIFKGKKALDEFAESQKDLNEALKSSDFSASIKNVEELRINIDLAKRGFLDKDKVLKQYNSTIGQTTGEVKSLDQAERELKKNASAFVEMTLYKAAAQVALENASKKAVEAATASNKSAIESANALDKATTANVVGPLAAFDQVTRIFTLGRVKISQSDKILQTDIERRGAARRKTTIDEAKKEQELQVKIAEDFQKRAATIARKNKYDFFGSKFDDKTKPQKETQDTSLRSNAEEVKAAAKSIFEDETQSYDLRFQALESYISASRTLVIEDAQVRIKEAGKDSVKISNIKQDEIRKLSDVQIEGNKELTVLTKSFNEQQVKDITKVQKDELQALVDGNADKLSEIESFRSQAIQGVNEQYAKGLISEQQYNQQLYDIDAQAAEDRLKIEIETLKKVIENEKNYLAVGIGTNKQLGDDEKKLADLEIKLSGVKTKVQIDDAKKLAEERKKIQEAEIELGKELFNLGESLGKATFTRRINDIEREKSAITDRTALEISNVQASTLSEQEKADKVALINAKAASDQAVLDEKIKQQKIKQARFDKAANIASIIMNTAVAVTKTLAAGLGFFSSPLAILTAALGAAQLATVVATPIPEYKGGKNKGDNYSGPAIVGDGGMNELVIEQDGSMYVTPNKPTLTHVGRNTQVVSGPEFKRMLAKPNVNQNFGGVNIDMSQIVQSNERMGSRMEKALKKQSVNAVIQTEKGVQKRNMRIEKYNSFISRSFRK